MDTVRVKGRVMDVRAVEDGTRFAVVLGPPPDLFTFRARKPPKLGQRIVVTGAVRTERPLGNGSGGVVRVLDADSWEDGGGGRRRHVDPFWTERVYLAMSRPLLPYQLDGAAWLATRIAQHKGAILGDDMGLGKTTQAIAALCATNAFPAVIVCPASVKLQWAEEFQHAAEVPEVHVIEGRRGYLEPALVFIINYSLLRHREEQLHALNPRVYVFDEGHQLKNPKARGNHRAAVATRLVSRTGGAVLLTGTPVLNRPIELWRLLHLADPKEWGSFARYKERYCAPKKGKEVGRVVRTAAGRVERLDELQIAVGPVMLRRLKSDVLDQMPPKQRRHLLVRLGPTEMAHYRAAAKDVSAWLRGIGQGQRALRAAQSPGLTRLTYLRRLAALGKLVRAVPHYLRRWVSERPGEPLVIFGYHRDVMMSLWNLCQRMGLSVTGIGGREPYDKRRERVEAFRRGEADFFLAPIAVAGIGLDGLQRACHALFVERIWTPSGLIQAEDRVHRLGQTRQVTITYLDAASTVDEDIAAVIDEKRRLIDAVVDDKHQHHTESMQTVIEVMDRLRTAG